MKSRSLAVGAVVLALILGGCTTRYSQSLAGRIPSTQGKEVRSSDTGFSLLQITFSEPKSAHEQVGSLLGGCSHLTQVEVDYRELVFFIVGIPSVTVTANCVK